MHQVQQQRALQALSHNSPHRKEGDLDPSGVKEVAVEQARQAQGQQQQLADLRQQLQVRKTPWTCPVCRNISP